MKFTAAIKLAGSSVIAVFIACSPASAQVMGFKTGEAVTGMTKQCFYNALGNEHTLTISAVALCPLTVQVQSPQAQDREDNDSQPSSGGTAFKSGERIGGMTKQCYYDYLGSTYTKTISSVALCPLSVRVN